jgi:cytochrome c553
MPRSVVVAALLAAPLFAPASVAHAAPPASAAPAARPAKLGQCVACHGERGHARLPGTPHLAGQDALYLANALRAYRTGDRRAVPMNAIANTLQPRDIEALARWYAAQPGGAR